MIYRVESCLWSRPEEGPLHDTIRTGGYAIIGDPIAMLYRAAREILKQD